MRPTLMNLEISLRRVKEHLTWSLLPISKILLTKCSVTMIDRPSVTSNHKLTRQEANCKRNLTTRSKKVS
uniref:Predicted protein n=1 Tax=Hordeum vulgare subsp. vulgare TaxID=112509 RepID=F2DEW9_HORVV|nr:predicted protein [Hordeum vulgare subsp. vulgare]